VRFMFGKTSLAGSIVKVNFRAIQSDTDFARLPLQTYLLRPREPWRSTVMCVSVYVCVCLLRAIFTNISGHVAYDRGSVLLRQGDEIPRGRGSLGVFFPSDNAL